MQEITQSLQRLFARHRIIFWYDDKRELRAEFNALALPDVEKIELGNNQFGVKYRILRQEPAQRFLLYQAGPPPADVDNWLLDVELAHGRFRADQIALWLTELGLGLEFADVIAPHAEFFRAERRRESLHKLLKADDTPRQVRLKLLAVCANAEPRLEEVLEQLLAELAAGKDERMGLITRCGLGGFLWEETSRAFGYVSAAPTLRDFVLTLFKSCYALGLGEAAALHGDALVFLKRWKDSVRHHRAFETLSAECATLLHIEQDLQARDFTDLVELDLFELIDRKVLSDLAQAVAKRTVNAPACAQIIRVRRQSHWYAVYDHSYEAIEAAAQLSARLDKLDLTVHSLGHGIRQYAQVWYEVDQLYRRTIYHGRASGQATLLAALVEQVENLYTNRFLLPLNDRWQAWVDAATVWQAEGVKSQRDFYAEHVLPFVRRGNKVSVVISDALRYEAGEELLRLIRQEDRYDADITPMLTTLPSYTQLGMAALLPHTTLALANDANATVLVDGASSQGLENRKAILARALSGRGTALRADELLALGRDESRALVRDHDVLYIYHNQIDAVGDTRDTEERVFDAVVTALDELVLIVKKLANANANNILVTADHGFIYQHRALEESDFAGQEPSGADLRVRNRRYVLGTGLDATSSFRHFAAGAVGLAGDTELLLPKSINRLRVRGAGSRYVHGGAALQEVVVPVIRINKKRQSDISLVHVDILGGASSIISTGQLSVTLYQAGPVTDKVQPRTLRAGIYTAGGDLISDEHELVFDFTSDNARERERRVQFVLTKKADTANGQDVFLRLAERVPDTTHYQEYKTARYTLRRSFTSDFDF